MTTDKIDIWFKDLVERFWKLKAYQRNLIRKDLNTALEERIKVFEQVNQQ